MRLPGLLLTRGLPLVGAGAVLVVWACASTAPDVAQQFKRYAEASASHNLAALEALTADNIVWQLGPRRLEGKQAALGPNAHDLGLESTLQFRDVKVHGNIVDCELVEANEMIRAIGMTEVRSSVRFTFADGRVTRKEPGPEATPTAYSLAEFNRRMVPLRTWIREKHPEAILRLFDANQAFVFSQDSGALMLRLTREWVAAGSPGRLRIP